MRATSGAGLRPIQPISHWNRFLAGVLLILITAGGVRAEERIRWRAADWPSPPEISAPIDDAEALRQSLEIYRGALENRRQELESARKADRITVEQYRAELDLYRIGMAIYREGIDIYRSAD